VAGVSPAGDLGGAIRQGEINIGIAGDIICMCIWRHRRSGKQMTSLTGASSGQQASAAHVRGKRQRSRK